jgi:CO dehydrogenase/acetyl-CoA synthase gamma subunit (corrinoid Fe-S protein)
MLPRHVCSNPLHHACISSATEAEGRSAKDTTTAPLVKVTRTYSSKKKKLPELTQGLVKIQNLGPSIIWGPVRVAQAAQLPARA